MPFTFEPLPDLPDAILVKPRVFGDNRGWFMETFKASDFAAAGIDLDFPQDNHSLSQGEGVLRGIHFQNDPAAQGKLVRVSRGAILDVAVDLRKGSPTYLKWAAVRLDDEDKHQLWVPPGFGHGFVTLTDEAEVVYKTSAEYSPEHDRSIAWDDAEIGVDWGITEPVLSEKDATAPKLADSDVNFVYAAPTQEAAA